MARIHIHLPEKIIFSTELKVRISNINYGNHLGNDSVLSLLHEARMQWVTQKGFTSEVKLSGNLGMVMTDSAIIYQSEAAYGDSLNIGLMIGSFNKYGFDLFYRVLHQENKVNVAKAKTGFVLFNYETRKISRMTDEIRKKFLSD